MARVRSPGEAFSGFQYLTPPLSRLDMTRIYRDAYERAGQGLADDEAARVEAADEFADEDGGEY